MNNKDIVLVVVKIKKAFTVIKSTSTFVSIFSLSLFMSSSLNAQERQGLLVNAALITEYDNNVLRKVTATSDRAATLAPELQYLTNFGKHLFAIQYNGEYALYNDNSNLNYDNHDISLFAVFDHSLKINSEFKLIYKDEVEEPGSNNSNSLLINEFNQINKKQAVAKFYYGTKQSIGQLVLGFDHSQNRHVNNLQNYRDANRNMITGIFYYRIAPKTRLLFQTSISDYDYIIKDQFPDQSSKETFYLAGIEWDITAKTSGTFKIGHQSKNFDHDEYNDITGLSYMLDMTWKPNTYSTITIGASRMTRESSQLLTSAFVTNTYTVDTEHEITPRTKIKAGYTYDNDDIITAQSRVDKRHNLVVGVDHSLLTWLNISLNYQYIQRKSDFEAYEFKANVIGLSLTTKFE